MAKSDKKDLYNVAGSKINQSEQEYNSFSNTNTSRGDTTWDRATENYNPAFEGYKDYAAGGGLKQEDIDRMRGAWANSASASGGAGGWGGITNALAGKTSNYQNLNSAYGSAYRPNYDEADTGFRKLSGTGGGFDEGQLNQIYGNISNLTNIGKTGGITDEDKANINRQSILDQEKTGGYTDQDKALIRAKSAASSPAYFGALKDNLDRNRTAMGGNLAGSGAVDFKMARQGAQQQAQDRINSEIGLSESIRKGRESAGQFLSNQGLNLADLRTKNQLTGSLNAGTLGGSTQQAITANQARGLQGLQESQTGLGQWGLAQAGGLDTFGLNKAGGLDQFQYNQANMDMQAQIANAQGAAAGSGGRAQAARDQAEFEQWLTMYGNEQKQYGIGGLDDLYKTNLGASQNYSGMGLDALNSKYGTQGQLLGLQSQNRGNTLMEGSLPWAKVGASVLPFLGLGGSGNKKGELVDEGTGLHYPTDPRHTTGKIV